MKGIVDKKLVSSGHSTPSRGKEGLESDQMNNEIIHEGKRIVVDIQLCLFFG